MKAPNDILTQVVSGQVGPGMTEQKHCESAFCTSAADIDGAFGDPAKSLVEMEALANLIRDAMLLHEPVELLASFWRQFVSELNAAGSTAAPDPIGRFQFALEYLHAVLACTTPPTDPPVELTPEASCRILGFLEKMRTTTMLHCMARCRASEDKAFDGAPLDVEFLAHSTWVSIRGHRYQALEAEFFRYVLEPHEAELQSQHGVGANAIADGIQSAADANRFGFTRAHEKYTECLKKAEALRKEQRLSLEEAMQRLGTSDVAFRAAHDEAVAIVERASFCNLTKSSSLPETVLEDLRFERGGNSEFFADGPYRGTALRTMPARLRPLIKLDDGTYAIDGQFLRDSAYRAIQRGLLTRNPSYRNEWNQRQKKRAETAFADIFRRQLTGAFVATDVFYPDPDTGKWVETDLVVILDDALIVLEAKAGVTAMDSPATDFHRHVRAIQALVLDAYRQAARFIRYLRSADQVPIFRRGESGFEELRTVSLKAMRLVLPIGLTLENFSPFSTMCKELPDHGPIEGKYPFVSMSIDDLLVLRRLLPSTGALFHYLTVRQVVAGIQGAQLFDEIDHLGAYISQNRMDQTMTEQLAEADHVWWDQFGSRIDEYFGDPEWERKPIPEQKFPETVAELLSALDSQRPAGFLALSGTLRDLGSNGRANLEETLAHLKRRGRQVPVMGMLAGGMEPIQLWGLPTIELEALPEIVRRAQVGCLAAKQASIMTLSFEVNAAGRMGRLRLRRTRAPSLIQTDYPAMLAEAKEMDSRRFEFSKRKRKKL